NMMISLVMIVIQAALSVVFILAIQEMGWPALWVAAGPPAALCCALGLASIVKARLLSRLLDSPVNGWRWALIWAAAVAIVVGYVVTQLPEWLELGLGIPLILGVYGYVIWTRGFGPDDRALFRMKEKAA
ncbi:MAG: lipopolysaccharide biosynthesis protein, partial [Sphingobium sp.]